MNHNLIIELGKRIQPDWETQKKMKKVHPRKPQYTKTLDSQDNLIHENPTIIWLPNSAQYPDVFLRPSQFGPDEFANLCRTVAEYSEHDTAQLVHHFKRLENLFGGQFRKQTGEPAFWHPRAVAINHIVLGNRNPRQTIIDLNHDCIEDSESLRNIVHFIMDSRARVDGVFEDKEILAFFDNDPAVAKAVFALSEREKILELGQEKQRESEQEKAKAKYYDGLLNLFPEIAELIIRSKTMDRLHYLVSSAWENPSSQTDRALREKKIQETIRYLLKEVFQVDRKLGEILKNAILIHIDENQFHRIQSETD